MGDILDEEQNDTESYAGFAVRSFAYLIDCVVLIITGWILGYITGINFVSFSGGMMWYGSIPVFLYFIILEASAKQGTIGKQFMKIKVVNSYGQRLNIEQSVIRSLCKLLSYAILCIGFIMVIFTERKQGLHDIIAKTFVIDSTL